MYKVIKHISTDFSGADCTAVHHSILHRSLKTLMFHFFSRRIPLVAIAASTLFLTGCIANTSRLAMPEFQDITEEQEINQTDDPDLQLVTSEPETALDQELEALSETGQWGEKTTTPEIIEKPQIVPLYDFPLAMNKQVEMYLNLFQGKQRKTFQKWLARSGKYAPLMEAELKKAGLPTDLVFLSMIESGYNQRAYSRARAVGLWQFMRATGRQYNLKVDNYVDERRDAEKSTKAAVAFLGDLYAEFGDWHLAVAAYNAGPGKIRKGLRKYKVDNFWDLARHRYLKLETKRYVPKLIAAIILSRDPQKYGFTNIDYADPLAYDILEVGPNMNLDAIAIAAGTNTKQIKALNQELHKARTPANRSSYAVKIPAGSKELASNNMKRLHSYVSTGYKTHKIRKGETVAAICRKYNINTTTLLKVNNLRSATLKNGTNLRIPYSTVKYQLLPQGGDKQLAQYKENLILHRIKNGETISKIAKKYRVPKEMIVSWNGLPSVHKIRAGQQLALYIENTGAPREDIHKNRISASTAKLMVSKTDSTPVSVVASSLPTLTASKKTAPKQSAEKAAYSWYKVRNGDSLWTISRRFNTSATEIRQLNNLKSNLIQPGSRLKVKKV